MFPDTSAHACNTIPNYNTVGTSRLNPLSGLFASFADESGGDSLLLRYIDGGFSALGLWLGSSSSEEASEAAIEFGPTARPRIYHM